MHIVHAYNHWHNTPNRVKMTRMKIILATPLYPPDIAQPAAYIKELARRLSHSHTVTVIAYARAPEEVSGVTILTISKRKPILFRLFLYTKMLWHAVKTTDVLLTENGASVALPAIIVSLFLRKPLVLHLGDMPAHTRDRHRFVYKIIEQWVCRRAHTIITDMPHDKPEILPFTAVDTAKTARYEASWNAHLALLNSAFQRYATPH